MGVIRKCACALCHLLPSTFAEDVVACTRIHTRHLLCVYSIHLHVHTYREYSRYLSVYIHVTGDQRAFGAHWYGSQQSIPSCRIRANAQIGHHVWVRSLSLSTWCAPSQACVCLRACLCVRMRMQLCVCVCGCAYMRVCKCARVDTRMCLCV